MDKELLTKYYNNQCSETESIQVRSWLAQQSPDKEVQNIFLALFEHNDEKDFPEEINSEKLFQSIHQKINEQQSGKRKTIHQQWYKGFKIAAMFLLPVAIGLIIWLSTGTNQPPVNYTQIDVPKGQVSSVTLPDGTKVTINSGSKLKYPTTFNKEIRQVQLSGEAYFDVHHNPEKAFIIKIKDMDIRVLGTSFNVSAYPSQRVISSTLTKGQIEINFHNSSKKYSLKPGQRAVIYKHKKKIKIFEVDTGFYTSWQDGIYQFKNEPLENIATKLELLYNVQIIFENEKMKGRCYTGQFNKNHHSIQRVMEIIKAATPIEYSIIEKNVYIKPLD